MISDLNLLSEKISRLTAVADALRAENVELRLSAAELTMENAELSQRMAEAHQRLSNLIESLPENALQANLEIPAGATQFDKEMV